MHSKPESIFHYPDIVSQTVLEPRKYLNVLFHSAEYSISRISEKIGK